MDNRDKLLVEFSIRAIDAVLGFRDGVEKVLPVAIRFVRGKLENSTTVGEFTTRNEKVEYIADCVEAFTFHNALTNGLSASKITRMIKDVVEKSNHLSYITAFHKRVI